MQNTVAKEKNDAHDDLFIRTERRLFSLPELIQRIAFYEADLRELQASDGTRGGERLRSVMRLIRPAARIDQTEARNMQIKTLESDIAADRYEVRLLKRALKCIREDPYYLTIEYKYFRHEPDEVVAEKLGCALTTVRRNRANLVRRVSVVLYGVNG